MEASLVYKTEVSKYTELKKDDRKIYSE